MVSLSPLLTHHGPLLVIDAASTLVQVGLLRSNTAPVWSTSPAEAGSALFTQTTTILQTARLTLDDIGAFLYSEGPGSMLGIRTVAMALRTWQTLNPRPAFAYSSLTLAAHHARTQHPGTGFAMIADARRDTWHCLRVGADGAISPLTRVATRDLPPEPLLTPENFRSWSVAPRALTPASYDLATLFASLGDEEYFYPVEAPDAFQHAAPEYKKWSAQIHQAPASA